MSDRGGFEQPKQEMRQILDIVPHVVGKRSELPDETKRAIVKYLNNPCVIGTRFRRKIDGIFYDTTTRFALGVITGEGGEGDKFIECKSIDGDIIVLYRLSDLIKGERIGPSDQSDEVFEYLGRFVDLEESDSPPKRSGIFENEIRQYL